MTSWFMFATGIENSYPTINDGRTRLARAFADTWNRRDGNPLVAINAAMPFEMFRLKLKTALIKGGLRRCDGDRKSAAGRKLWDEVLIFKVLVLQTL